MATQNDKKIICEIYILVLLTCNIFIIIIPRTNLLGLPFLSAVSKMDLSFIPFMDSTTYKT